MKLHEVIQLLPEDTDIQIFDGSAWHDHRSFWPLDSRNSEREIQRIEVRDHTIRLLLADPGASQPEPEQLNIPAESVISITKEIKIRLTMEVEGMDDEAIEPI